MSYQFDDESALEELLNQQLDRSRQQASSNATIRSTRPLTAAGVTPNKDSSRVIGNVQRPSSSGEPSTLNRSSLINPSQSKNKFGDWLNPNQNKPDQADDAEAENFSFPLVQSRVVQFEQPIGSVLSKENQTQVIKPNSVSSIQPIEDYKAEKSTFDKRSREPIEALITKYGNTEELQKMSKQRLVQLVLEELLPVLQDQVRSKVSLENAQSKLIQLESEIEKEKDKGESLKREQNERLKLAEASWIQINKQLSFRLELYEKELKDTIERYNGMLSRSDEEQRKHIESMVKSYEVRLEEQRELMEAELKRRQTIHELEMSSRLRISGELSKLDSIFNCWNETIESTINQFETQFKSIELLMDKQTSSIRGNNEALMLKNQEALERDEKLDAKAREFEKIFESMKESLKGIDDKSAKMSLLETLMGQIDDKLQTVLELSSKLDSRQDELKIREKSLEEERFEIRVKTMQLEQEVKLNDNLKLTLEAQKEDLKNTERLLSDRDRELNMRQNELDKRITESIRNIANIEQREKYLNDKEHDLSRLHNELAKERRSIQRHSRQISFDIDRLSKVRADAQKELNQLRRLQKSIVCSICLDSLCKNGRFEGEEANLDDYNIGHTHNKWPLKSATSIK